jgi:hypothetical protein
VYRERYVTRIAHRATLRVNNYALTSNNLSDVIVIVIVITSIATSNFLKEQARVQADRSRSALQRLHPDEETAAELGRMDPNLDYVSKIRRKFLSVFITVYGAL